MTGSDAPEGLEGPGSSPRLAVGAELAGYRIESLLGRGGMGVVYRAHDVALDRKVALKVLAPELAEDEGFRERFLRESRLAASLDHPAIVPIYDAGQAGRQLYIAMRLVDGTDLKRLLAEDGVLEPERALQLVEQIADALDAAHERGLVHRDVKPSNVLIDERGHAYLADFGLSRRLAEQPNVLGGGRSLGTVDYVAPEQIRGEELDGRADLYSLGCLLYECLAGRPPFSGGSDTAIVFAHLQEEPPTLPGLEPVIAKALAKEPDDRYQSGRELVAAARDALEGDVRPRRRWLLAAVAALAVAVAAMGGVLAVRASHTPASATPKLQPIPLRPDAVNLIDAKTRRVVGHVSAAKRPNIGGAVTDIAFSGRSAWILTGQEQRLIRVAVPTRRVTGSVKLPWVPSERIATGGGLVWVREARNLGVAVLGIDARSGRIARRFSIGGSASGVAYGDGALWLVGGAEVLRVDPRNGRTLHRFPTAASWLVFADGAVWAASEGGLVWKIDPVENKITARARLHSWLSDIAVGGGSAWVSVIGEDAVYQLSEDDLSVQKAAASGPDPERISTDGGDVWVANTSATTLSLLAADSGTRQRLATGTHPTAVYHHHGLLWTGTARGLPPLAPVSGLELRVSTPYQLMNVDPVSRVFPMDEQLSYATCANLLNYADTAGPAGTRLRPEIAAAMPGVSRDGRTYTFRIRPGFRFSPPSNEAVTAETFRHTIERTLYKTAQGWPYAPDIVGAAAYKAGKGDHISGITARGTTLSISLVRPAGDFLTRLSMPVFCPVPLSTPLDAKRSKQPIPSTGPYYIASIAPHRTVLLRNPNYAGSHPHRATRIVFTDDIPTPKAAALVDGGQIDYLPPDFSGGLLGPGGSLDRRFGPASSEARAGRQRFFLHVRPLLDTIIFNTRRPLFHDARLRQAASYALDRAALAKAYFDAPGGRVVPAAVPGYDPGRVYPIDGPDLRRARRLAGSRRRHAVLLAPCHPDISPTAAIVRSNLARIGITLEIVMSDICDGPGVAKAFARADLLMGTSLGRGPPDRDPAPFFDDALTQGAWGSPLPSGPWSAPAFRKRIEQARALRGDARIEAYTRLDDELARMAPLVVYGAYLYDEYFSPRVGCKLFQAFYQVVDLGALCLKKQ